MDKAPDVIKEEGKEYVSIALAAQIAGYHPQYIRRMVLANELPAIRRAYGGFVKVFVLREALRARNKSRRIVIRVPESEADEIAELVRARGGTVKTAR